MPSSAIKAIAMRRFPRRRCLAGAVALVKQHAKRDRLVSVFTIQESDVAGSLHCRGLE